MLYKHRKKQIIKDLTNQIVLINIQFVLFYFLNNGYLYVCKHIFIYVNVK
jgi:hypothetical protein